MSPSWKVHSYKVAEPEEDAVTCELIMIGWLGGCFSWEVLPVDSTDDLPEARVGKWVAGRALSWVTALPAPLWRFFCCLAVEEVVC